MIDGAFLVGLRHKSPNEFSGSSSRPQARGGALIRRAAFRNGGDKYGCVYHVHELAEAQAE
jgi:hypothetical protein